MTPAGLPPSVPSTNFVAIAAGGLHTCALTTGGGVKCWGWNMYGQLGNGTTIDSSTPVDVSGLTSGVKAVSAGVYHTCALMGAVHGGGVKCWGSNGFGQLGDGTSANNRSTPVDVSGLTSGVTVIAVGAGHTCVLTTRGGVMCWGDNGDNQLGDGTTTQRLAPVNVSGLTSGVKAIAAGVNHTCVLTTGGGVKCWGNNWQGQLGDGTTTQRSTPIDVSGLTNGVMAIVAGDYHTCVLTTSGGVKCWGDNEYSQLGDDGTTQHHTLVDVSGLTSGVTAIAAGSQRTCALMDTVHGGGVKCWGSNPHGQMGEETTQPARLPAPVDVIGLPSGITAIAAGGNHTCALTAGGGVKCWGWNSDGQLGDGTTTKHLTPVDVIDPMSGQPGGGTTTQRPRQ